MQLWQASGQTCRAIRARHASHASQRRGRSLPSLRSYVSTYVSRARSHENALLLLHAVVAKNVQVENKQLNFYS
jgi:hypothetical protein